jgi:signal transduction histidine kinase
VVLEVRDRGSGFDPDHTSGGLGLDSMRERAASVGGTLAITSTEGNGTSVRLTVPRTPARRGER